MIFINADLSLIIKFFITPVVLKFHSSKWHIPLLAPQGNELYLPSWSVVGWMAIFSDFYPLRFLSCCPGLKRAQFGAICPGAKEIIKSRKESPCSYQQWNILKELTLEFCQLETMATTACPWKIISYSNPVNQRMLFPAFKAVILRIWQS